MHILHSRVQTPAHQLDLIVLASPYICRSSTELLLQVVAEGPPEELVPAKTVPQTTLGQEAAMEWVHTSPFIAHRMKLTSQMRPYYDAMKRIMEPNSPHKAAMESISGRKALGAFLNEYLLKLRKADGGFHAHQWLVQISNLSEGKLMSAFRQWEMQIDYPTLVETTSQLSQEHADTRVKPKATIRALRVALKAATSFPPTSNGIFGSTDLNVLFEVPAVHPLSETQVTATTDKTADDGARQEEEAAKEPTEQGKEEVELVADKEEASRDRHEYSLVRRRRVALPSDSDAARATSAHKHNQAVAANRMDSDAARATSEHKHHQAVAANQLTRRIAAGRMAARCMQAYFSLVPQANGYCSNPTCGFWKFWNCDRACKYYGPVAGQYHPCWPYCGLGDGLSCFSRHAQNLMEIAFSAASIAAIAYTGGTATPAVLAARTAASQGLRKIGKATLKSLMKKAARKMRDMGEITWEHMKRRLVDDIQIKGRWRGVIVNGGKGNIRETAFKNTCTAIGKAMLANAENGDADDVLPGLDTWSVDLDNSAARVPESGVLKKYRRVSDEAANSCVGSTPEIRV